MTDPAPSPKTGERSILPYHISRALCLPILKIHSLNQTYIIHPVAWDDNYKEFVSELQMYFGAPDIIGEAKSKLENLVMKPNQCIAKYLVEFNKLASITGWDNCTLQHQFYCGLPGCIKDEVSQVEKPATLPELQTLAQQINGRYWE